MCFFSVTLITKDNWINCVAVLRHSSWNLFYPKIDKLTKTTSLVTGWKVFKWCNSWMFAQGLRKVLSGGSAVVKYDCHRQGLFSCTPSKDFLGYLILNLQLLWERRKVLNVSFLRIFLSKAFSMWGPSRACGKMLALRVKFQQNLFKKFSNFGSHWFSTWKTRCVSPCSRLWQQRQWSNAVRLCGTR